jgi:hypothetical protein
MNKPAFGKIGQSAPHRVTVDTEAPRQNGF